MFDSLWWRWKAKNPEDFEELPEPFYLYLHNKGKN
jgi:hypothetical protein